jgi:hypothetical protein
MNKLTKKILDITKNLKLPSEQDMIKQKKKQKEHSMIK